MPKTINSPVTVDVVKTSVVRNIVTGTPTIQNPETVNLSDTLSILTAWYDNINWSTEALYGDIYDLFENPYLTFTGTESFTLKTSNGKKWNGTIEYSTDKTTWTEWDGSSSTVISSGSGNVLYLRGKNNTHISATTSSNYSKFVFTTTGTIACNGDIRTLLNYEDPENTTMDDYCYAYMFQGCTSLTVAPALPATTLAGYCYAYMFNSCTSLTTIPALPATTLANNCYTYMFQGCTNIKLSIFQTGDYKTPYRIPTSGTGTAGTDSLKDMFENTGGTYAGDPSINATFYTSNAVVS